MPTIPIRWRRRRSPARGRLRRDHLRWFHAPVEKNVEQTKKAVELIKSINPNCLVEGEIGYIGSASDVMDKVPEGAGIMSTPEEARQYVTATKVDVLAPAVGNMHGMLTSMVHGDAQKRLDIPRIAAIRDAAGVFMTLHGGSGTNDEDFKKAIKAGMNIVHVNTEIRLAWKRGMEKALGVGEAWCPIRFWARSWRRCRRWSTHACGCSVRSSAPRGHQNVSSSSPSKYRWISGGRGIIEIIGDHEEALGVARHALLLQACNRLPSSCDSQLGRCGRVISNRF